MVQSQVLQNIASRRIDKETLKTLSQVKDDYVVSIYMPTEQAGKDTRKNHIRLKNRVKDARRQLEEKGLAKDNIDALLEPAQNRVNDNPFWQHQRKGLAMFLMPDRHYQFRLPLEFEGLTVVNEQFHLKALMPLLTGNGRFYVLAVSLNKVRFFEGNREGLSEIAVSDGDSEHFEDVPISLAESLKYDVKQMFISARDVSLGQTGSEAKYYGQGASDNEHKTNILRFFQQLDKGVTDFLHDEEAPLVFVGVDYLFPIYQKANHYNNLLAEAVTGNPDELSAKDLNTKVWDIAAKEFDKTLTQAKAHYQDLSASEQCSDDLVDIVKAAFDGRVDTLFVTVGKQCWGHFNQETRELKLEVEQTPNSEDLLNRAAVWTLNNSGKVYALQADEMPNNGFIAALFRF